MVLNFFRRSSAPVILLFGLLFALPIDSLANPTQFGDSGLNTQPTAQTLNEGNICVGLWANCFGGQEDASGARSDGLIIPATLTMGLGSFMEAFGSYPNMLFNGDEDVSGRGAASAGFKFRVFGKRSDAFRIGWDILGRRTISNNSDFDGLTDYVSRVIASYKLGRVGFHVNAGYAFNDSPESVPYEDQLLMGGGIEFFPINRLRMLSEFSYESEKVEGVEGPSEVSAGFQYFMTPHLTFNMSGGVGLSESSPDWRAIIGFTTCQGVGTYNRPVPTLVDPDVEPPAEEITPPKPVKIRILTPLIAKATVAESPVNHLEVPINRADERVLVNPVDRLETPQVASLSTSALSPIVPAPTATDVTRLPQEPFPARVIRKFRFPEYTFSFNQWDLSEEGVKAFNQIAEHLREDDRYFLISIEGHTDDVGPEKYNMNLSFRRAVNAATHLVIKNGIDPTRIFVKAYGETQPIASNDTEEGRSLNRRVELMILIPDGYEKVRSEVVGPKKEGDNNKPQLQSPGEPPSVTNMRQSAPVDALSIEQAISDKTGDSRISPAGAFSQTRVDNERD